MAVKRRSNAKSPPVLSHEFVIQNHADIVACLAMVFVAGLMFQATSSLSTLFITLQYNVTVERPLGPIMMYGSGPLDAAATFFYMLILVVVHQVLQEYVLDKIGRKLHLSKVRNSQFNESGQLVAFYLGSAIWAADLLFREGLLIDPRSLWINYPHVLMNFGLKFFMLNQLAYWIHTLPELYFQKVKKDEYTTVISRAIIHLLYISTAYLTNLNRLAVVLLGIQYAIEALFHSARLLVYADRERIGRQIRRLHDLFFVLGRLVTILAAVLTLYYGLAQVPEDEQIVDFTKGNFNVLPVRLTLLAAILGLQASLMYRFITETLRRWREEPEEGGYNGGGGGGKRGKSQQERAKERKEKKLLAAAEKAANSDSKKDELDELPEVDQQNVKKGLRQRK